MDNIEENQVIEILKSAILMEKRGKAFYKKIAEQVEDPEVKKIFSIMSKEEDLHIRMLSEQFTHFVHNKEFKLIDFKENGGEGSVADIILSKELKNKISASGFEAAAISAAIDMENKAIEVYETRAKKAETPAEKNIYSWLAEWEQSHLSILNELDKELLETIWFDNKFWPF